MKKIDFKKKRARSLYKRFTLIEVLVVVAIIGILASLLMPMLSKARGKAKSAVCRNQLKQINIAVVMHSDDSNNILPYTSEGPARHRRPWHWTLAPYLGLERNEANLMSVEVGSTNIFRCPNDDKVPGWPMGYAMPMFAGWGNSANAIYDPVDIANVSSPSEAMLFGEAHTYYFNGGYKFHISMLHQDEWHRFYLDGHVERGFGMQGLTAYNYRNWSYYTGQ
jgi:prepilin-type N-terminal cleavage/methylation domain-containing protein